jgi:hypothetical protein
VRAIGGRGQAARFAGKAETTFAVLRNERSSAVSAQG